MTDLVQAQTTLAQAVLSYINQLQDYNKALLELARNTGLTINQAPELIDAIGKIKQLEEQVERTKKERLEAKKNL